MKGWIQVGPASWSIYLSLLLFAAVFLLGFLGKRFWCRYVCPSGAVFSAFTLLRIGERKVETTCIHCQKCHEICPFDAIQQDDTTCTFDCAFCQTCGGACPTHAIKFVTRWNRDKLKEPNDSSVVPRPLSRRGFIASSIAAMGAALGMQTGAKTQPLRPPGSVPEPEFLDLCIRCGECFKVCPGPGWTIQRDLSEVPSGSAAAPAANRPSRPRITSDRHIMLISGDVLIVLALRLGSRRRIARACLSPLAKFAVSGHQ